MGVDELITGNDPTDPDVDSLTADTADITTTLSLGGN